MISEIQIQNFKSIQDLKLKLGRVTVLIGENGSGKSNLLEAIAFAGCAAVDKLDNEYLAPRGVRITEDTWMVSAFPKYEGETKNASSIKFAVFGADGNAVIDYSVSPTRRVDNGLLKWVVYSPGIGSSIGVSALLNDDSGKPAQLKLEDFKKQLMDKFPPSTQSSGKAQIDWEHIEKDIPVLVAGMEFLAKSRKYADLASNLGLSDFLIYAPENTTLRLPPPDSAIQPLGTKGEGFFKLLQSFTGEKLDAKYKDRLTELQSRLHLFGWFDEFLPPDDLATNQARLQIRDRWLAPDRAVFDQRSANEGFLLVLFYFTVLMSWRTPVFFAIDNIDTALNPKLCSTLMTQIVELAKQYGKQIICTTHNPAILDGLNLKDDEQRLYTVSRDSEGHTRVRRVTAPEPQRPGELPVRLSEAFQRGLIGGLPENF